MNLDPPSLATGVMDRELNDVPASINQITDYPRSSVFWTPLYKGTQKMAMPAFV
jgi:hypothetical protein